MIEEIVKYLSSEELYLESKERMNKIILESKIKDGLEDFFVKIDNYIMDILYQYEEEELQRYLLYVEDIAYIGGDEDLQESTWRMRYLIKKMKRQKFENKAINIQIFCGCLNLFILKKLVEINWTILTKLIKQTDISCEVLLGKELSTPEFDKWYKEEYCQQQMEIHPEETEVRAKLTKNLKKRKKDIENIREKSNEIFKDKYNVTIDKILVFIKEFRDNYMNIDGVVQIKINDFLKNFSNITYEEFLGVIEIFSYDNIPDDIEDFLVYQLRCFYKKDDKIYFNRCIYQVFKIFEIERITLEYSEYWGFNKIEKEKIKENHKNIATYFSYVLADVLDKNGYMVPEKDDNYYVDIKKVKEISFNDIDVLAYSKFKQTLYNIEVKCIKQSIKLNKLIDGQLKNKYYYNLKDREILLNDNKSMIIDELFGKDKINDIEKIKVKSVIVTLKPDFRGFCNNKNEKINKGIEYFTWNKFLKVIEEKYL